MIERELEELRLLAGERDLQDAPEPDEDEDDEDEESDDEDESDED